MRGGSKPASTDEAGTGTRRTPGVSHLRPEAAVESGPCWCPGVTASWRRPRTAAAAGRRAQGGQGQQSGAAGTQGGQVQPRTGYWLTAAGCLVRSRQESEETPGVLEK